MTFLWSPGIEEAITDVKLAEKISQDIGFPILIKAAAGGGGKGMRVVDSLEELPEQMDRAISEAVAAIWGTVRSSSRKFVTSPRHIEIQVLADNHGNVVHLFERECSVQRRHQKGGRRSSIGSFNPQRSGKPWAKPRSKLLKLVIMLELARWNFCWMATRIFISWR